MSHDVQHNTAAWRRPDEGADALVAVSWLAVLVLALLMLRPTELPQVSRPETAPANITVAESAPAMV